MAKKSARIRAAERAEAKRKQAQQRNILIGVGAIVLIGLIALVLSNRPSANDIVGLETLSREAGGQHDTSFTVAFGGVPPTNGVHNPAWQNCGIYDTPVQAQYAIHSLEHGAVWVKYNPDEVSDSDISTLEGIAREQGTDYTLLSPYPDMDSPIVLSAWGYRLQLDDVGDERIGQFFEVFLRGAQAPEAGAACNRSFGQPSG